MGVLASAASVPASWRLGVADRSLFGGTIFLSAFLLFQVQPIVAKQILPWFGGSAAVWTTSLLFFQATLFGGYAYAHCLRRFSPPRQRLVHGLLLLLSLLALPVMPSAAWKPVGGEDPLPRILGLLATTVGLPYFVLSATSPLLQLWLTQRQTALPWRFYAISNAASLAALLAYPLAIEPLLSTYTQAIVWSLLYAAFAVLCGRVLARRATNPPDEATSASDRPPVTDKLRWIVLAGLPCLLSLSVTAHLCQNVAAVPFLWVLPLALYLLSLVLCFEGDGRWCSRRVFLPLQGVALGAAAYWLLDLSPAASLAAPIALFGAALWIWCMYLHGELARRKPEPRHLTSFYLMMSAGGALGAAAAALGAPYLLRGAYELPIAIALCAMATLMLEYRRHWASDLAWVSLAVGALVSAAAVWSSSEASALAATRNFYGAVRVVQGAGQRSMVHGAVSHGAQLSGDARRQPTAYYASGSGIAAAIEFTRRPGQRIGVVGLGVGTLAAYARPGDFYRFYEINPDVVRLARQYFTFLSDAGAAATVAVGDGRLLLEREAPQQYDVLAIDAFAGDSIPVHLLSREAFGVYFKHVRPDGILALHVSNTALALAPVAERLAASAGKDSRHFHATADPRAARAESDWVLVGARLPQGGSPRGAAAAHASLWTDDYSNLLEALK